MRYRVKHTLRQWRVLMGISQTELGEMVGKTKDTISRWERGTTSPTAGDIAKLEQALNIKWSDDVIYNAESVTK